jgi:tol-pal system protein YbgF
MQKQLRVSLAPVVLIASLGGFAFSGIALGQDAHTLGTGAFQVASLFGESDEEKAERLRMMQHEQAQDGSIRYFRQRNDDLERTVRQLNGEIEQLDHHISELTTRMERMQKDFEYRLCRMAATQLGASGADEAPVPCNGAGAPFTAIPPPAAAPASGVSSIAPPPRTTGGAIQLAPPPGVLGTLPSTQAAAAPPSSNRMKFDSAMRLLASTQYDEARSAFRSFADTYPKDELAPQAVYWFGDIAYVQKDYAAAARAFAEEIKKYPDSTRAPDSMLKLGQSLIAMGQKQEGCAALAALPTKYPTASQKITSRAAEERKNAHCH